MSHGGSFDIPEFYQRPQHVSQVWRLQKAKRFASCELWTHPTGGEIRVEAAGDFVRSEAGRNGLALIDLAIEWKAQFIEKGWNA